ncbi:lebercilin isoform 1-T1 [Pelodytes ibericus]
MKDNQDPVAGERGRTRSRRASDYDKTSDVDKNSDSYFSDDFDNTTYGSERSPTPISKSRSPRAKKLNQKMRSSTPVHNRDLKSKFPSGKKGHRFRSHSLNKESHPKDIDLLSKRMLSARLLKIKELGNELTELQIKLEELQKENKTLKKLQFRQQKALNKFEDTESEISKLLSRHNNEMRTLREQLRKSQEKERNSEKRLKETEDELYRANASLKELKQLSENRHLAKRKDLTKKLVLLESQLDERDKRVKDLEKNIELTQNSFQRQLKTEKKKSHDAQEETRLLRGELQRLTIKLNEKERELEIKNIYAYRLSKPSPKKDTPRSKVTKQSIKTRVLTYNSPETEFSPTPPLSPNPVSTDEMEANQQEAMIMEQDNLEKLLKEETEKCRKEKERTERRREQAEKERRDREQKFLEDKARKLRDEWEQAEFERNENVLIKDKSEKEENTTEEQRRKKELLLAKMFEIDKENSDSAPMSPPQTPKSVSYSKLDTEEKKHKTYRFSEPTEKLFSGLPVHNGNDVSSKTEATIRRHEKTVDTTGDFTFGNYAPSFGKGRSGMFEQKTEILEDPLMISNTKLNLQKVKKSNLMEQLFGGNSSTTLPKADSAGFTAGNMKPDPNSTNQLPWEKNNKFKGTDEAFSTGNNRKKRSPPATGRPVINAIGYLDDDIEEVLL